MVCFAPLSPACLSQGCFPPNFSPMFRTLFLFIAVCLMGISPVRAAEVELLRVWPGWRDAEAFDRIGEYFGRGENSDRQVVRRTQATVREGFYFLVRVRSASDLVNAKFELNVIRPDAPEPKTIMFPAAVPAKETVFHLGLTGAEWPAGPKANPVAWRLALVAADGRVLAEHKSFLWEKPAK